MIEGAVSGNSEAIIRLTLPAATGAMQEIEAVIDTGFTGDLTLPPALIRQLNLPWKGVVVKHCSPTAACARSTSTLELCCGMANSLRWK